MPLILTEVLSHPELTGSVLVEQILVALRRQHRCYRIVDQYPFFRTEDPKHLPKDYLLAQSPLCAIILTPEVRLLIQNAVTKVH